MTTVWEESGVLFARDGLAPHFSDLPATGCLQPSMNFVPGTTYHFAIDIDMHNGYPTSMGYAGQFVVTADNSDPVNNGSKVINITGLGMGEVTHVEFDFAVDAVANGSGSYDGTIANVTSTTPVSVSSGQTGGPHISAGADYVILMGSAEQHHGAHQKNLLSWVITDDAVTPEPPPDPPGGVIIDDDGFTPVAELTSSDIEDMKVRIELQGTGSGLAKINRHNAVADEDNIKKGNWLAFMIPQIQDDAIFLTQIETLTTTVISTDEEGGEVINIAGRGALSYMERAKEMPRTYVVPAGEDYDGVKQGPASTGAKVGQILNRTLAEFQHVDRGVVEFGRRLQPIAHLTHDFDYTDDSAGDPWDTTPSTAELSAGQVGQNGLTSVMNLIGTAGVDVQVWPNMVMQAWNEYGRDLTGAAFGAGVVRFVKGVNIAEKLDRQFAAPVDPTDTIVQGNPGKYAYASHPLAGSVPDVEGFVRTYGDDVAALEAIGESDMLRRIRQGESVQFRVTTPRYGTLPDEDAGLYLPGPSDDRPTTHTYSHGNYWVGDTVTLSTGTGFHDFDDVNARIMAITIEIDEAGDLDVTVELKATTIVGRFPTTGTPGSGMFGVGASPQPGGTGGSTQPPPIGLSDGALHDHIVDTSDAHDASAVSFVPTGSVAATNVQDAIAEVASESSGVTDADYLVGTAHAGLSAEIVVGTTPGGELGGTWASPTVDTTHSGSSHTGAAAAAVTTHEGAADPHTQYTEEADNRAVIINVDGGGSVPSTGVVASFQWPRSGHLRGWRVISPKDVTGSCVFDVWKDSTPVPTVADTITASAKPTLSSAKENTNNTLTGWTTAFSTDDYVVVNLDSVSTLTLITLILVFDFS